MIKGLILSLQFFSRIPINMTIDFNSKNLKYCIFFLPLVGAIIGALGGLSYYILSPHNLMIASFISLLVTIILTGGLHLDGLSDTFDGFLSSREKEETLEIMKDSTIGAFGALSLIILVFFKFILFFNIESLTLVLILSFTNSRWIVSWIIASKKISKSNGLGKMFSDSKPRKFVVLSGIIYTFILLLTNIKYIIPLTLNFLLAQYISHISYKKIGGLTGDVYGCIIEIGEVISLLGFWLISI